MNFCNAVLRACCFVLIVSSATVTAFTAPAAASTRSIASSMNRNNGHGLYMRSAGDSNLNTQLNTASSALTSVSTTFQLTSTTALHAATLTREDATEEKLKAIAIITTKTVFAEESIPAEEEETKKPLTYLDDGFVFGLEGSGISRPRGKVASVVVEGDSLVTQPYQVAMVSGTFFGHAAFATLAIQQIFVSNGGNIGLTALQSLIIVASSWVIADFGSGVLHWSVDNYGNGRTPVMGTIIAAFQGHHSAPWTITERGFCNNVYKLCIPFGIIPMTVINFLSGPSTTLFFAVFCVMEIMSQEQHKWSHMTKKEVPAWVNWLQDMNISIPRVQHTMHHNGKFDGNYCIVSGVCNNVLDSSGIFRRLEHLVYKLNGVESNSWKLDPATRERTLAGNYALAKGSKK